MPRGSFLVIDGTDGTGKKTQAEKLMLRMKVEGYPVLTFAFPRYETPTGQKVKRFLMGEFGPPLDFSAYDASVFYAEDRKAAATEIEQALASGVNVVADRYVAANMGHQGSKIDDPVERMAYFRWVEEQEYGVNRIPRPDINVILHVPSETAMTLIEQRGNVKDGHENLGHLKRAEETYLGMARTFHGFAVVECVECDRLLTIDEVHQKVWRIVQPMLAIKTVPA